ncbi:TetR/AcrR family transcriptional regulator [Mesorhizobium sp. AR07]|uniref:TetR/AcrR family transcriptional regulator n=1 Tax=Mesorhizobium sp. AR07 TaxID=2865838 RepID=UPI0021603732|nr:TetR/AcrR family transcriptional regulator [Mesorhizobium sp. AR07]UVK43967.1 TetR/AcrR family transcriptional regulator [Mesorhizobium sp. AR07]
MRAARVNREGPSLQGIAGVHPSKQPRSLAKRNALIAAGLRLLRTKSFDEMTIGHIAEEAGCSVGTFYARFEDKEAFLILLQEYLFSAQVEDARQKFMPEAWHKIEAEDAIEAVVRFVIETFRGDAEGVLRAALVHSAAKPEIWEPARRTGRELVDIIVSLLSPKLGGGADEQIRLSLQMLYGALINMILHEPGPLKLNDPASHSSLVGVVKAILLYRHPA